MNIRGSICALATPFAADGALDLDAFGRLLDYQLAGGTQALVVAGSTGEAHMLEHDEFDRLLPELRRFRGKVAEHHELFERTKEAWNKAVPWARANRLE